EEGGVLLDRMRTDMEEVETALAAALEDGDLHEVRSQTHILMSLASAVAALPTEHSARRLNRLTAEGDPDAVAIAGKVCLGRLAALRHEMAAAR
ncbi:MAG: hypothetical protein AAF264_10190, partial [Pseudomonadota bacterium]